MRRLGTQTMTTDRLTLRRFCEADASAMYANWASDPQVTQYVSWKTHESAEATAALLREWEKSYDSPAVYNWAVELDGTLIGSVGVVRADERNGWCEIGYCLGRAWWGQGLTTEAVKSVMAYLFFAVGFHRVFGVHAVPNAASGRVLAKCGMKYEGTLRRHLYVAGRGYADADIYGLVHPDDTAEGVQ